MAKIGKRKMKRSKRTELARQVIASDFQVQPVEEDEGWILFAAERKDFFHFVEYNETDGNTTTQPHINHLAVTQHHIPHLAFARAMDFMQSTGHEYVAPVQGRIEIMPQARGEMFLVIRGSAVLLSSLAAGLEERIKRVSSTLATARKRVVCEDGRYLIPGATRISLKGSRSRRCCVGVSTPGTLACTPRSVPMWTLRAPSTTWTASKNLLIRI
jgi:hypothetical protein